MDDGLTNGIFTATSGSESDDTESILSEYSGLYTMLYFVSAK